MTYRLGMGAHGEQRAEDYAALRVAIGRRLKAARNAAHLSLEKVGESLGVSKAAVGHWETGRNAISAHEIGLLAGMYHVTTDALILGVDDSVQAAKERTLRDTFEMLRRDHEQAFTALYLALIATPVSDDEVAKHLPPAPWSNRTPK